MNLMVVSDTYLSLKSRQLGLQVFCGLWTTFGLIRSRMIFELFI